MLMFYYQHGICGILLCREFCFVFLNPFVFGNQELFRVLRVQSCYANFHWRPYSKSLLKTFVIVKMDVLVDGRTQLAAAIELVQEIHLCLHNSPETFHWAIVDAMPNAGHRLLHPLLRELELECFTGILEPPVTVEQRVCFRIFANRLLKCVKHQLIVIASAYDVSDNRPIIEIEDGAQIELLND